MKRSNPVIGTFTNKTSMNSLHVLILDTFFNNSVTCVVEESICVKTKQIFISYKTRALYRIFSKNSLVQGIVYILQYFVHPGAQNNGLLHHILCVYLNRLSQFPKEHVPLESLKIKS